MAKRKTGSVLEKRRKQQKISLDAELSGGVFSTAKDADLSEIEADEDEQEYELKPRVLHGYEDEIEGLPIIGAGGKVKRVMRKVEAKTLEENSDSSDEEPGDELQDELLGEADNDQDNKESEDEEEEGTPEERIAKLKEEIADLASKIMEDPEENYTLLSRLRRMAESKNPNTCKLALLSLVPIFKSICPSYKIRALTDVEKKEKVSREVARVRSLEQSLVVNYKHYIDLLTTKARITSNSAPNATDALLGRYAANAACELATALRHFNNRADVMLIVCRRVSSKPTELNDLKIYSKCITTLETLLLDDAASGDISFDVIRLLTKSIKAKHYRVDESVVNIFLSLTIIEDYDPNTTDETKPKINKKDRIHLSKKQRKQRKENQKIEKEMRVLEQAVSEEERERYQAQILRMLLAVYLEMLKNRPESLMASVLEGLAKYGHMANFDLLGDFLEVLREVSGEILENEFYTGSEIRQVLLCIVTSFALMSNHAQFKVSVDLSSFINALYKVIPYCAIDSDLEFSHKSLRLVDPLSETMQKPSVNVATKIEIILKSLDSIFFRSKNGSNIRLSAFTKRIYQLLLHVPEKSSIALLKFTENLMARHQEICGLYSTEDRISNGSFSMEIDDPNRANPQAATLWETVLLQKHYCPAVRKGAATLFNKSKEASS